MRNLAKFIADCLTADRDRWILWAPVCLAMGIGVYFLLMFEPPVWAGAVVFILCLLGFLIAKSINNPAISYGLRCACLICSIFSLGFTSAQIRTLYVTAPVIAKTISSATFKGQIKQIERFPSGPRVTLGELQISRTENHQTPATVRLRLRGSQPKLEPGDWITGRARISPPGGPAVPGGFDFQRHAFFQKVGGFGFSFGRVQVTAQSEEMGHTSFKLWLSRFRDLITTHILAGLDAPYGGIAAALMTGAKHAVAPGIVENLRNSGLAHLLSISGLHIGLIAGLVFAGLRSLLVLIPGLALRYPIKKWAAVGAIMAAFIYALLAGATLPTQRAFLMAAVALIAVVLDRRGISLRSIAGAAFVVLLIQPESLLGPSFQMSFAAATALVGGYEVWGAFQLKRMRTRTKMQEPGIFRTLGKYFVGVCMTTIIASAATAPFALYHFHQFAEFSLFANLVAVPITALWVMPWAVIAFIAMPFGLESWVLQPMGWGIWGIVSIAEQVANWPGAVTRLPAIPTAAIAFISMSAIWLVIWRQKWRLLAISCLFAGLASFVVVSTPDIIVDGAGRFFAIKTDTGSFVFSNLKKGRRDRDLWLRHLGEDAPTLMVNQKFRKSRQTGIRCDEAGCLYLKSNKRIAISHTESAFSEDCWTADVVISLIPIRSNCSAGVRIDWFDLWRNGSHSLTITPSQIVVRTANDNRGQRPWVLSRK